MKKILLFLLFAVFIWNGCGRKTILRKYYVIEIPAPADSVILDKPPLTEKTCEILPVSVAPPFANTRIALRKQTHEITYYVNHRWAVKPDEVITQQIERHLQQQRIFSLATSRFWKLIPDYQLKTEIYQLEAVEENGKLTAHLHIDFSLVDTHSRKVVIYFSANRFEPLPKKNMNLFADALSNRLSQELHTLSQKMTVYFQNSPGNQSAEKP